MRCLDPPSQLRPQRASRCLVSQQSVNRKQVKPRVACVTVQCPSKHTPAFQTCRSQATPPTGPVFAEGNTLLWDQWVSGEAAREPLSWYCREGLPAPDKTLSCSLMVDMQHYHIAFHFSNQLIAAAVNSLWKGQLAGMCGCNNCVLTYPLLLSSLNRFFFFLNASSRANLSRICPTVFHK